MYTLQENIFIAEAYFPSAQFPNRIVNNTGLQRHIRITEEKF